MSTAADDIKALTIAVTAHMAKADERDIAHMARTGNLEAAVFGNDSKAGLKVDVTRLKCAAAGVVFVVTGGLGTWGLQALGIIFHKQ